MFMLTIAIDWELSYEDAAFDGISRNIRHVSSLETDQNSNLTTKYDGAIVMHKV